MGVFRAKSSATVDSSFCSFFLKITSRKWSWMWRYYMLKIGAFQGQIERYRRLQFL